MTYYGFSSRAVLQREIEITERYHTLRAGLSTCCGVVLYEPEREAGIAHATLPTELTQANMLEGTYLTPRQGVVQLAAKLRAAGSTMLFGGLLGCMDENDEFVEMMAAEAREVLADEGIPILFDYMGSIFDTDISLTRERISVSLTPPLASKAMFVTSFPLTETKPMHSWTTPRW